VSIPSPVAPERTEFATTDMAEAREVLDHCYRWRLTVQRPGTPGSPLSVFNTTAGLLASARGHAPGDLSYQVRGEDFVVIDTLYQGTFELEHGDRIDRYGPGDVFIANQPGAEFRSKTHDIDVLTTTLPSALFTEVADTHPDHAGAAVEFTSYTPITGRGQRWRDVARFVDDLLGDPDAAAPLVIGTAARLLAATALSTFPNTLLDGEDTTEHADATPETLRRALAFIDSHAGADIGLADIAAAAYATPRAVQYAFRRHCDTTPTTYLRQVRLAHTHRDLQAADPIRETVTSIAAAWGFAHPGRFAGAYRQAYGQAPSTTLHT
jgi:AraC-like DNA-binding protein